MKLYPYQIDLMDWFLNNPNARLVISKCGRMSYMRREELMGHLKEKPMFTPRHLNEIARIIAGIRDVTETQREVIAWHFGNELKGSNPNFDPERFYAAAIGKPAQSRDNAV